MRLHSRRLLRGAGKLVAVLVVASLVGAGVGFGVSEVSGDDPVSELTPRVSTPPVSKTDAPVSQAVPEEPTPSVRIDSAVLTPAETLSGQQRQRARLSVRVRVSNRGTKPLNTKRPFIIVAGTRVEADPNADDLAGVLLEPIPGGESATGTLRFETAGRVTGPLADGDPARLRIAGRSASLDITVDEPQPPDQPRSPPVDQSTVP